MKNRKRNFTAAAACAAAIGLLAGLTSCQGRRMSNMVPSGDTVELAVDTLGDTAPAANL